MAPQLVKNKEYNYKADIWSFGSIIFTLFTGKSPFDAKTREQFELQHNLSNYQINQESLNKMTLECILLFT